MDTNAKLSEVEIDRCEENNDRYIGNGFRSELTKLLNSKSMENASNSPDYILAAFLTGCLVAFDIATKERDRWNGKVQNYIPTLPPNIDDLLQADEAR